MKSDTLVLLCKPNKEKGYFTCTGEDNKEINAKVLNVEIEPRGKPPEIKHFFADIDGTFAISLSDDMTCTFYRTRGDAGNIHCT